MRKLASRMQTARLGASTCAHLNDNVHAALLNGALRVLRVSQRQPHQQPQSLRSVAAPFTHEMIARSMLSRNTNCDRFSSTAMLRPPRVFASPAAAFASISRLPRHVWSPLHRHYCCKPPKPRRFRLHSDPDGSRDLWSGRITPALRLQHRWGELQRHG